ncbi:16420_t:CDS:2, partial [Acaulospora colombiana]
MPSTIDLARPGRPVDLVVCTHLDGLSQTPLELERDIQTRKDQISRVFGIDNSNIVMATPVWGATIYFNGMVLDLSVFSSALMLLVATRGSINGHLLTRSSRTS